MTRIIGVVAALIIAAAAFSAAAGATGDFCENNPDHRKCQPPTTTEPESPPSETTPTAPTEPTPTGPECPPGESRHENGLCLPPIVCPPEAIVIPGVGCDCPPDTVPYGKHQLCEPVSVGTTGGTPVLTSGELPHTGAPIWIYALVAWLLIVGGALLFWAGRERSSDDA